MIVLQDWFKILGSFLIAFAVGYGIKWHISEVDKAYERGANDVIATSALQQEKDRKAAEAVSSSLKEQANKTEKAKNEEIDRIKLERDNAIRSLYDERKKRPKGEGASVSPSVTEPCTAASLYAEDAEFLTREASRADTVMEERDFYFERYEDARKRLKEFYED